MLNPEWHDNQRLKAELHWAKVLEALGADRAASLLLGCDGEEVNIGVPYYAVEPTSNRPKEFQPDRKFLVEWISARRRRDEDRQRESEERTLKMQRFALAISAIGGCTALVNAIVSFVRS